MNLSLYCQEVGSQLKGCVWMIPENIYTMSYRALGLIAFHFGRHRRDLDSSRFSFTCPICLSFDRFQRALLSLLEVLERRQIVNNQYQEAAGTCDAFWWREAGS